ncbi:MAG: tRNA pseudouridine(55) synthase TruB [Anaerolineales bacterium]|nr:tRNA pseudouridine(55) synthase TruB [Anaerolineales bacterium]
MTSGLLLIDKPSGPTSHDVVAAVRRGAREKQVGHAGTLDPLATGLLVVCLGAATRLSEYLLGEAKGYQARVRFGQATTTYDAAGEVTAASDRQPERAEVEAALAGFRGPLQQRPPAFSAIKRGGQRAYDLARRGEAVDLAPRPVTIHALRLTDWAPPDCGLEVRCSAGTYIRSLAHDLGQVLGCGAHLAALRRTHSGHFELGAARPLAEWQAAFAAGAWQAHLLPMDAAVPEWPAVPLTADETRRVQNGQAIPLTAAGHAYGRAYNAAGEFFAVLRADPAAGVWRPEKVLRI